MGGKPRGDVPVEIDQHLQALRRGSGPPLERALVDERREPQEIAAELVVKIVHLQAPAVPIEVMVNRVGADEVRQAVFERLHLAADRFLRRDLAYLGCMREDEALRRAARRPGALLETRGDAIEAIAARVSGPAPEGLEDAGTETRGWGT